SPDCGRAGCPDAWQRSHPFRAGDCNPWNGGDTLIQKVIDDIATALSDVKDGSTILIGGFGSVGQPNALIDGLIEQGATDLVVVSNNAGVGRTGLARLLG